MQRQLPSLVEEESFEASEIIENETCYIMDPSVTVENENLEGSSDQENFDEPIEQPRANWPISGLVNNVDQKYIVLVENDPKLGLEKLMARREINQDQVKFFKVVNSGAYSDLLDIDSVEVPASMTSLLGDTKMKELLDYAITNVHARPKRCHLWFKKFQSEWLLDCIKDMLAAPIPDGTTRSLLRLETKDSYDSLKSFTDDLMQLRQYGISVNASPVYASSRDPSNPRKFTKAQGAIGHFRRHEEELKQVRADYLVHFRLVLPSCPRLSVLIIYHDKAVSRNNGNRWRQITIDHLVANENAVTFDSHERVHCFDIETEEDLSAVKMAYDPVLTLMELHSILSKDNATIFNAQV